MLHLCILIETLLFFTGRSKKIVYVDPILLSPYVRRFANKNIDNVKHQNINLFTTIY